MTSANERSLRVTFLAWRDTRHPEGGGSEVYVDRMARHLAERGHTVTIFTARYPGSARHETLHGVRTLRAGGRLSVYLRGLMYLVSREGRAQHVVVDVANGLPFAAGLVRRAGVLVLIHHVHQKQWELIYPGTLGRLGWFVESRLTTRLYRRRPHITVSEATRQDLIAMGVEPSKVQVVRNGMDHTPRAGTIESPTPRICVLSRLVPHKAIEDAIRVASVLRPEFPGLVLDIIGAGWWQPELVREAEARGARDIVKFHGHVPDETRDALLAEAWVMLLPSLKEGWGLAVLEAGAQGTPTVAYAHAGGVNESIVDGVTGAIVPDETAMVTAARELLLDYDKRTQMGEAARSYALHFDWEQSGEEFAEVIREVADLSVRRT